jgi:histidinol dehydrogenase
MTYLVYVFLVSCFADSKLVYFCPIVQAEHGPDSQVVLVAVGDEVDTVGLGQEVERQCRELPRDSIATKALSHSYIVIVKDMAEVR